MTAPALLHTRDGVATVTLNRPERLNAWTGSMEGAYRSLMLAADRDPLVRVIVVTGAGRGFCAGADSKALAPMAETGTYTTGMKNEVERGFAWQMRLSKPVIAAINGPAAGVGLVLALYCDVRIAAPHTKLTTSFAKLGLPAEYGATWLLPRLVGHSRAADLLLSSRVIYTEEAVAIGLVDRVGTPADAHRYAADMATTCSPRSLATIKNQLWSDLAGTLQDSIDTSVSLLDAMVAQPDFREGAKALSERRQPNFATQPSRD